ncbi:MAG TPA: hypothetical protein VNG53_11040, partial [Bacteroidia bacterium]|nr:hypothetical protein [Bacteroidia bacterium]
MKTKSNIFLALFFTFSFLAIKGNAQFTISNAALKNDSLYLNNINALFDDENIMGFDIQKGYQDYQVPKGSGISSIYSSSLWIGGIDAGGHLRVAGQTYKQNGTDFWPGPLDTAN